MTLSAPDADVFNYSERYLRGKIKVALGGRVAEEINFGEITTGAESDIQQATQIARGMVAPVGDERGGRLRGRPGHRRRRPAPARRERGLRGDPAARRPRGQTCHRDRPRGGAQHSLERERDKLDALAEALLREETLDERDAYRAAGIDRVAAPA